MRADVRRNTRILFAAQVILTASMATIAQLGSLIVHSLTGSVALAGVTTALFYCAIATSAYPSGRFMDVHGRRPGLVLGFLTAALGAGLITVSVAVGSFAGFLLGVLVYSLGVGAGALTRAAVTDMYPASRRAAATGMVITGGLIGAVLGPVLVAVGNQLANATDKPPLAVPWALSFGSLLVGAVLVGCLRPDPKEIGLHVDEYFPEGSLRNTHAELAPAAGTAASNRGARTILSMRAAQAAILTLAGTQAAMAMLMGTASLALSMHHHEMGTISFALVAHYLGMYGLTVIAGRFADRIGRRPVMLTGALLSAMGSFLFPLTLQSPALAALMFLLNGAGWSLTYVAGTALLGDLAGASVRARVFGINDAITSLISVSGAFLGGVLLANDDELLLGSVAAALALLPLLVILRAGGTLGRRARPVIADTPA